MRRLASFFVLAVVAALSAMAAPVNLVKNPRFATAAPNGLAANWPLKGFLPGGYKRVPLGSSHAALLQNEASNPQFGGSCQVFPQKQTSAQPIKITAALQGQGIQDVSTDPFGANIYTEITFMESDVPIYYGMPWEVGKNVGTFSLRTIGSNTGTLPTPWKGKRINTAAVCVILGKVPGKVWFRNVSVQQYTRLPKTLFAMMGDDGDLSWYTNRDIFISRSIPVTIAGVTSYLEPGPDHDWYYMDTWQLEDVIDNEGWDVACHSCFHNDMTTYTDAQVLAELRKCKQFFIDWGMATNDFIIPFGTDTPRLRSLIAKVFRSARNVWSSLNYAGTFAYDIRAFEIKRTTTLAEFYAAVEEAIATGSALVVFTHRIDPVECMPGDDYCTTRPFLISAMDYIKVKRDAGRLNTLRYRDVVVRIIQ